MFQIHGDPQHLEKCFIKCIIKLLNIKFRLHCQLPMMMQLTFYFVIKTITAAFRI